MPKIYVYLAGKTLDAHEKFVRKLTKRGAKVVASPEDSDVAVVFCPIVSRFESDIEAALHGAREKQLKSMILVAMHHTFDENYPIPNQRQLRNDDVTLLVDCLFYEGKGLLKCPRNKTAVKTVRKKLELKKGLKMKVFEKKGKEKKSTEKQN